MPFFARVPADCTIFKLSIQLPFTSTSAHTANNAVIAGDEE